MGYDMTVYFGIGNFLVAISISEDACDFCQFDYTECFGFSFLLSFLYHFLEYSLHFRDIGYSGFILIAGTETLEQSLLDILRLVIHQH